MENPIKIASFFPVFISADKNMVPIEHLYNIQKMWENSFFPGYILPSPVTAGVAPWLGICSREIDALTDKE